MKKLNVILMLFLCGIVLMSCEKDLDSADVSSITKYPVFEMQGDAQVYVERGTSYEDPGVTATEGGAQLDVTTTVVGTYTGNTTFDSNVSDIYTFTYSAVNQDGFTGSTTRTVYVVETGDLVTSISGLYTSTIIRNDILTFEDLEYVFISNNDDDDTYDIQDGIGMYYAIGTNYGLAYSAPTTVTAVDIPTNTFTYSDPFPVGAFGGAAVMSDMVVDPAAQTIEFTTTWDLGYTFQVTLTQTQF